MTSIVFPGFSHSWKLFFFYYNETHTRKLVMSVRDSVCVTLIVYDVVLVWTHQFSVGNTNHPCSEKGCSPPGTPRYHARSPYPRDQSKYYWEDNHPCQIPHPPSQRLIAEFVSLHALMAPRSSHRQNQPVCSSSLFWHIREHLKYFVK